MKIFSNQNKSIIISLLNLILFEAAIFLFIKKETATGLGIGIFLLADILLITFSLLWFMTLKSRERGWMAHMIIPFLLNMSIASFIFLYQSFWFGQAVSVFGSLLIFLSLYFLEKDSRRRYLVNISAFFTALLFFASAYSLIAISPQLYWLAGALAVALSSLLIYYKLSSVTTDRFLILFFVLLFMLLLFEFFVISLSLPLDSFFLKSLVVLIVYYLYWGILEKFLAGNNMKKEIVRYIGVTLVVLLLIFVSLIARGNK